MSTYTMHNSAQKYSPRWLKDILTQSRESTFLSVVKFIETSRLQDLLNLVLICVFVYLALKAEALLLSGGILVRGKWDVALVSRHLQHANAIFALLAVGTLSGYLKPASLPALQFVGFIIGLSAFVFFTPPDLVARDVWLYILLNYGIFFGFYVWYYASPGKISSKHYFFSLFILLILVRPSNENRQELVWVVDSVRFLFVLSLLTLEHRAGVSSFVTPEQSWSYFFSPAHLVTPLPIESIDWKYNASWEVRLRGLADVTTGYLFLLAAYFLKENLIGWHFERLPWIGTVGYGFINYIYYFLGSFAWIAIPAGVARWYGVDLPAYFDNPLLATSPFDRWKRWNTYYYNWFNKIIFFPIFKKTRSLGLGVAAVFAVTILIHYGRVYDGLVYHTSPYLARCAFFIAHGFCVYVSLRFKNLWPSEKNRNGWWGVLLVTLLMSLIHLLGA